MSKYKIGEKVRIRPDLENRQYGGCLVTRSMVAHAGEVVTIKEYGYHGNYFRIVEELSGCESHWYWSDEMVEPVSTYKIGDRVIVESSNIDHLVGSHEGKVGTIVAVHENDKYDYRYNVSLDNDATLWCKVKCLVEESEEKKVFIKKDIRNGDIIVRRNGNVEIAIVDHDVFVSKNGWNDMSDVHDDLTTSNSNWDIVKVIRPTEKYECQFNTATHSNWGDVVYDREKDAKPLYNGKVVCIDNTANPKIHTVGKVYQFKDGQLTADNGRKYPGSKEAAVHSFEEWADWTSSKFIEVVE